MPGGSPPLGPFGAQLRGHNSQEGCSITSYHCVHVLCVGVGVGVGVYVCVCMCVCVCVCMCVCVYACIHVCACV